MSQQQPPSQRKQFRKMPSKPIETVRAELMADPETQKIAKHLQLEVAEYVEKVLWYAYHPEEEPQLEVVDDATLKAQGFEIKSIHEVKKFMEDVIAGKETLDPRQKDAFSKDSATAKLAASIGGEVPAAGAAAPAPQGDSALREELQKQLKKDQKF